MAVILWQASTPVQVSRTLARASACALLMKLRTHSRSGIYAWHS